MKPDIDKRQKRIHQKSVIKKRISEVYRKTFNERQSLTHAPFRLRYFLSYCTVRFCYCNEGKKHITFAQTDLHTNGWRYDYEWSLWKHEFKARRRNISANDYDLDADLLEEDWIVGWLYGDRPAFDEYEDLDTPKLFKVHRKKFAKGSRE